MIDDLLSLAEELTRRDAGRPKQSSLRRAAASAYYAVFHAVAKMCADELVGPSKPWSVYTPIYRSVDHNAALRVLKSARFHDEGSQVAAIGLAFTRLHDARIEADYLPEPFAYSRQETRDLILEAQGVIAAIAALPPPTRLSLAVKLIAKTR